MNPPPNGRRKTGVFKRLKELVTGTSELESRCRKEYQAAKEQLQRKLKEGKITVAEVTRQLQLLRSGNRNGSSGP